MEGVWTMAFLEELAAAAAQDPKAASAVFVKWLRTDWRSMYAELRAAKPILQTRCSRW